MSGTARGPRGDQSLIGLATLTTALVLGSLSSCSNDVLANPRSPGAVVASPLPAFDSEVAASWEELIAHTQRISPTPNWDGSVDGMKTLWYERGTKQGEGRFVRGRKEDAWTFWYENGQRRWEGSYHLDLVDGVEHSWYPNGTLCYEGTSVAGKRHGAFRAFYEDGQPWWNGDYSLGVREGTFCYWHRDGSPDKKVSGSYVKGKRVKGIDGDGLAAAQ